MKDQSDQTEVRLAIIGAPGVGKSALTVRFLTKRYIGEYEPDVEFTYRREIHFEDEAVSYSLRDASGKICLNDTESYVSWSSTLAVVYSIVDRSSFIAAAVMLEEIRQVIRHAGTKLIEPPTLAIFGNKYDLSHRREVGTEEGRNLALKYGASFYEVSASNDFENVFIPFNTLLFQAYINCTKRAAALQLEAHQTETVSEKSENDTATELERVRNAVVSNNVRRQPPVDRKQSVRRKLSAVMFKKRTGPSV